MGKYYETILSGLRNNQLQPIATLLQRKGKYKNKPINKIVTNLATLVEFHRNNQESDEQIALIMEGLLD